jgi:hypothetical protein
MSNLSDELFSSERPAYEYWEARVRQYVHMVNEALKQNPDPEFRSKIEPILIRAINDRNDPTILHAAEFFEYQEYNAWCVAEALNPNNTLEAVVTDFRATYPEEGIQLVLAFLDWNRKKFDGTLPKSIR